MTEDKTNTEADAIAELARAQTTVIPSTIDGFRRVVLHDDTEIYPEDDEHLFEHPRRARGDRQVHTLESFLELLSDLRTGASTVWVAPDSIVAVLNDDRKEFAGWRDDRIQFVPRKTSDYKKWLEVDGVPMSQIDFARLIDEHASTIASPATAELMELAEAFSASINATFRRGERLKDGSRQIMFTEEVDTGEMIVPDELSLAIRPYIDSAEAFSITAKLSFKISRDGDLKFTLRLANLEDLQEALQNDFYTELDSSAAAPVYRGKAPAPREGY